MVEVLSAVGRLCLLSVSFIVIFFLTIAAYRLWFHPLAKVPGPRLAAISNVWLAYHVRNGRARELGKHLHSVYGSVVRVGPTEVWFDSEEAFRKIYGSNSPMELSLKLADSMSRNWQGL